MKGFQPGDPRAVAAGKRAGVVSGERRRERRESRWKRFGIDPEVGTQIRQQGYNSGWRAGYTAGLRKTQESRS